MSEWGILVPIAIFTVGPMSWAFNNWTRARHGYEPERWRSKRERREERKYGRADVGGLDAGRKVELLTTENERLTGQIGRLEERLRVLERIATDPAERTAREIDALR